jgi:N6-adenosine-specific RNA methylase IME4
MGGARLIRRALTGKCPSDEASELAGTMMPMVTIGMMIMILAVPHPFAGLKCAHYGALLVDAPIRFECFSEKGRGRSADRHYRTMLNSEIAALPVGDLAARDCHLFYCIPGASLTRGDHLPVMRDWGFKPSALAFVWAKSKKYVTSFLFLDEALFARGMGHTTRQCCEFVVLGRRGSPRRLARNVHQLIISPKREHSRKPDELYRRIQQYCAGPYAELFARERRPGWDCWGDEVDKFGGAPPYDGMDDFAKSLEEGYRVIRERVAAGGEGWRPK